MKKSMIGASAAAFLLAACGAQDASGVLPYKSYSKEKYETFESVAKRLACDTDAYYVAYDFSTKQAAVMLANQRWFGNCAAFRPNYASFTLPEVPPYIIDRVDAYVGGLSRTGQSPDQESIAVWVYKKEKPDMSNKGLVGFGFENLGYSCLADTRHFGRIPMGCERLNP